MAPKWVASIGGDFAADVADAERDDDASERAGLARLDGGEEAVDALLAEAIDLEQVGAALVQAIEVAAVADEAALHEQVGERFAEAVDIHGAAADEVLEQAEALGGALAVGAAVRGLALGVDDGRAADGAVLRHVEDASSAPVRMLSTGPTTWGMTSPARWTMTVSPTRTSLRRMSSSLCRVASLTVTPAICTGSSTAKGLRVPVRPTLTSMRRSLVVACMGGNL